MAANPASAPKAQRSTDPLRTTRPRLNGIASLVVAAILAALAALAFWMSASDRALIGPASAMALLAVSSVLIALMAFRVADHAAASRPLVRPLRLVTILTVVIGLAGAVSGMLLGVVGGSIAAIGLGVIVFIASLPVALHGALVHGAAQHEASSPQPETTTSSGSTPA